MPGHKRNDKFHIPSADIDITEIDGFDNLHCPEGIIRNMENNLSSLFESKKSIISVNGSTCCVLASICAVCDKGDKIIIARNCHKSVYNACFLKELDVKYIEPEFDIDLGTYTYVTQEAIDKAYADNKDAKAIVITSPTYEGFVSKVKSPIPLIVDSAHGSHFGLADWLPKRSSGDIVINSLHKTLPCLTQTAVVNIYNNKFAQKIKMYIDIFETSSPSYILLSSVDKCIDFIKNCNAEFDEYKVLLDDFYSKAKCINGIKIYNNDDLTRIIISADGYTGNELAQHLRNNGIEVEGATLNYVILISTVADKKTGFDLLINALKAVEKRDSIKKFSYTFAIPKKQCKESDVDETILTDIVQCVNKVSGEYIFAYPPGIPLVVPGEIISRKIVDYITLCIKNNVNILSDSNQLPNHILTKAEQ